MLTYELRLVRFPWRPDVDAQPYVAKVDAENDEDALCSSASLPLKTSMEESPKSQSYLQAVF